MDARPPSRDAATTRLPIPAFLESAARARLRWAVGLVIVGLLPVVLWQTAAWTEDSALTSIRAEGRQALALYVADLQSELEKYAYLPRLLAENKDIVQLLARPRDATHAAVVNRYLERINAFARASATYVMAGDGTTLAASNWNRNPSFVGHNFRFRPYFRMAMNGELGRYFALGTTSQQPGYYLSHPVYLEDGVVGVVVVKVGMERLEGTWAAGPAQAAVTDGNGVVFIASRPGWRFRTLGHPEPTVLAAVKASRQYHDSSLAPLDVTVVRNLGDGERLVTVDGATWLMQSAPVTGHPWTFLVLSPAGGVTRTVAAATTGAGLASLLLVLAGLFVAQRRGQLRDRLAYQQKVADTLARTRDELERRVVERTADLQAINQRLRREIAERHQAERVLRATRDELVQAGKLAVLGHVSAGISHELNQPLGAIRSYADNARTFLERGRPAEAAANLSAIAELTERMASIITHLKTFARRSSGEVAAVSVAHAAMNALDLLAARLRSDGVAVVTRFPDPDVHAAADAVRLEQVLINLITNALDAMKGAPRKTLSVAVAEDATARTVAVTVADSGPGIPEDVRAHLFDPFFTTKEVGEGLGLGLTISYRIVSDFGGTLAATNDDGKDGDGLGGARFTVTLPRAKSQARDEAAP